VAVPAAPAPAPEATAPASALPEVTASFFAWLLSQPNTEAVPAIGPEAAGSDTALDEPSRAVLAKLDEVIQSDPQRSALLPRAPQVLPQLMRSLRDDHYVSVEVAARIGKDAVLAAEVIRAANGSHRGSREPIVDLSQAVLSIGADHLRRVIAKSVLRPIFDVRGARLSAMAAPQIWVNAEFKARLCSALAAAEGLDPLDGACAAQAGGSGLLACARRAARQALLQVVAAVAAQHAAGGHGRRHRNPRSGRRAPAAGRGTATCACAGLAARAGLRWPTAQRHGRPADEPATGCAGGLSLGDTGRLMQRRHPRRPNHR
jgi:hypothetical protein